MAHSLCIDPMSDNLSDPEKKQLLEIARLSIQSGLDNKPVLRVDVAEITENLSNKRATFVTLTQRGNLRGCMGNLEANEILAQSVANTAYNAAFRDPRFPNLTRNEIDKTLIDISVLTPMQEMSVANRDDLLNQLRPGVDGLLLEDRGHRATFLPKVWESLKEPQEFLQQLLRKAGLTDTHWSDNMCFHRYQTDSFHD